MSHIEDFAHSQMSIVEEIQSFKVCDTFRVATARVFGAESCALDMFCVILCVYDPYGIGRARPAQRKRSALARSQTQRKGIGDIFVCPLLGRV